MEKQLSLMIDIGNSQISAGIFDGLKLVKRFDVESTEPASYKFGLALVDVLKEENIAKESIKNGFICSVVPGLTRWVQIVTKQLINVNCLIAGDEIQNLIKKDKQISDNLGADLIADIVGAISLYKIPCIITDLGTVTKTLVIDKNGVFLGATFFPGLKTCFESMSEKTAMLPSLNSFNLDREKAPEFKYGKNTVDCMRAGIYWGTISEIIYSNKILSKELGENTTHIITGGYSEFIKQGLTNEGFIDDHDLVLKGMAFMFKELSK